MRVVPTNLQPLNLPACSPAKAARLAPPSCLSSPLPPFAPPRSLGKPQALVLIRSAIKDACGELKVAKLFAKHLKVEEQTAFLKSSDVTLGAGSPNRITKLVELGKRLRVRG